MKLPSGREISIDSLIDVVEMLGEESFHQENADEAEETVSGWLADSCFSLSGTESSFDGSDIVAIMDIVRLAAEEISGALMAKMDEYRPRIKEMVEKEIANASNPS